MDTVSIYFFRFSVLAPGVLKDYCILVPSDDASYRFESLNQSALEVPPACADKHEDLLNALTASTGFVRSYECPIDLAVQILATLTRQPLDGWAVLRWDAIDKPLLHDLVANLQGVGKRLEGRVLCDCS